MFSKQDLIAATLSITTPTLILLCRECFEVECQQEGGQFAVSPLLIHQQCHFSAY